MTLLLGHILNTSHADEFNQWMAFEAGADEQHTLGQFLDYFKKWEAYESRRADRVVLEE
jgi:hypothetical protein